MPYGMRQEHDDAMLSVVLLTANISCSHLLKMTAFIRDKVARLAITGIVDLSELVVENNGVSLWLGT